MLCFHVWTWLKMFFIRINLVCNFQEFHFWEVFSTWNCFQGKFFYVWNRVEENNRGNFQGIFFLSCVTEFYSPVCEIEYKHIFRRILFSRVSNWVKKTFFFQENNLEWQQKCKYFFFLHVRGKKIWGEFIKNSVCVKPIKETFRRFYFMCETDWIEHFSWKTSQKFYLEFFCLLSGENISSVKFQDLFLLHVSEKQ